MSLDPRGGETMIFLIRRLVRLFKTRRARR
jgi:hypothetical protein